MNTMGDRSEKLERDIAKSGRMEKGKKEKQEDGLCASFVWVDAHPPHIIRRRFSLGIFQCKFK